MDCEAKGLVTSSDAGVLASGCAATRGPAADGAAGGTAAGSAAVAGSTAIIATGCNGEAAKDI